MALTWRQVANFGDGLWALLKQLEASVQTTRWNIHVVGGNWTIGVGFDMDAGGSTVRIAVYKGMGLDGDLLDASARPANPTAQQLIELGYLNQIEAAVAAHDQRQLNSIMGNRAADTRLDGYRDNRRSVFAFNSDTEVRGVLDDLWPSVYREKIFSRYPSLRSDPAVHTSYEMLALASLVWNGGPGILGSNLGNAIVTGDRAEAWYEIRYKSNKNGLHAKRRYVEAALFGLYDVGVPGDAESKQAYRMYTRHGGEIQRYEAKYGGLIGAANSELNAAGFSNVDVKAISDALQPARDCLIAEYVANRGIGTAIRASAPTLHSPCRKVVHAHAVTRPLFTAA